MRIVKSSAMSVLSIILPASFYHTVLPRDSPPFASFIRPPSQLRPLCGLPLEDRVGVGQPDQGAYSQDHIGLSMLTDQTKKSGWYDFG
jgi:hypothetical protein